MKINSVKCCHGNLTLNVRTIYYKDNQTNLSFNEGSRRLYCIPVGLSPWPVCEHLMVQLLLKKEGEQMKYIYR